MPSPLLAPVIAFARRLRYPTLFKITAALFALTLLVPDPLPFVDELLLGLGTLLLATWKDRGKTGIGRDPLDGEARRVDRR
jgi:hypothetical protein